MDIGTGIAIGGLALSVVVTVAIGAWNVSAKMARLEAKIENGISAALKKLQADIGTLFGKWDDRSCPEHTVQMQEFRRRLEKVEE